MVINKQINKLKKIVLKKIFGIEKSINRFGNPLRYNNRKYLFTERIIEYPFIHRNIDIKNCKYLLDFGCNYSFIPIQYASLGIKVFGVDLLNYKFKNSHSNFIFIQKDIRDLDLKIHFDYITAISTFEHIGVNRYENMIGIKNIEKRRKLVKQIIEKMYDLLIPNGYLLITLPLGKISVDSLLRCYSYTEFKDLFLPYFKFIIQEHYKRINPKEWVTSNIEEINNISNFEKDRLTSGVNSVSCFKLSKRGN